MISVQAGEVWVARATDKRGWELPGRTEKSFLQDFPCQMKQVEGISVFLKYFAEMPQKYLSFGIHQSPSPSMLLAM